MIEYVVGESRYCLSYQELKNRHYEICSLMDEAFIQRLPEALHLACIIGWLKELGTESLGDRGIIHELVHLLHIPEGNTTTLHEIRKQYETVLKLE